MNNNDTVYHVECLKRLVNLGIYCAKSFHNKCNYVHPLVYVAVCEGFGKREREIKTYKVSDFCALPQNHNKSYSFWHLQDCHYFTNKFTKIRTSSTWLRLSLCGYYHAVAVAPQIVMLHGTSN